MDDGQASSQRRDNVVGKAGFEPAASASRTLRAAKLRYFPWNKSLASKGRNGPLLPFFIRPLGHSGVFSVFQQDRRRRLSRSERRILEFLIR